MALRQRLRCLTAPQSNFARPIYCLLLAAYWRLLWERVSPGNTVSVFTRLTKLDHLSRNVGLFCLFLLPPSHGHVCFLIKLSSIQLSNFDLS